MIILQNNMRGTTNPEAAIYRNIDAARQFLAKGDDWAAVNAISDAHAIASQCGVSDAVYDKVEAAELELFPEA